MNAMKLYGRFEPNTDDLTAETAVGVYAKSLDQDQKDEIKRRLESGERQIDIANSMGLPIKRITTRVYQLRQQRQMELPHSQPKEEYLFAKQLWEEGKTIEEMAKACEMSFKRMCGVIDWYRKRFGWFPKRYKRKK